MSVSQKERKITIRWGGENVPIPGGEEIHYPMGRRECLCPRMRGECPYPKRRGGYPHPMRRVSLCQEERRVSLSHEEKRFPNHMGEETRLPCTTHGEEGSQVHLS